MSTNMDRPEAPRSSASVPIRRVRRSALPAVAALEDRKLMTGGFGMGVGPMAMMGNGPAEVSRFSNTTSDFGGPQLSFRGDFVHNGNTVSSTPATSSTDGTEWVNAGAAAQLGPFAGLIYSTGDKFSGPFGDKAPTSGPTSTISSTDATSTDATDDASDRDKLDAAFTQLRNDMQSIQDNSEVTPKLLAALRTARNNLVAGATGTVDSDMLTTLQDDQKTILDSGTFTVDQQATLKSDYTAVLQSEGVSDDAVSAYFTALDAVKTASNVTSDNLTTLSNDQQAIQTLLDAQTPNSGSSRDQTQPSAPGQGMPGGGFGMGGFTMDRFGGGFGASGRQGGGTSSQTSPLQQGGGFSGQQQATMISPQSGGFNGQQQATPAVASQNGADVQEQPATPTDVQQNGADAQLATPADVQQGGAGGRHRTVRARTFQGGGGMPNRMATIRFSGRSEFGGGNGGGRRF